MDKECKLPERSGATVVTQPGSVAGRGWEWPPLLFLYRPAAMRIGVAKEIKPREYRVALTPAGALELVQHGHDVIVEQDAGVGSGFTDDAYTAVGARIASVDEVWALGRAAAEGEGADRRGIPAAARGPDAVHVPAHRRRRAAHARTRRHPASPAIAYETVETPDRRLPLLAPMSEVAGRLAPQMGAWSLEKAHGGRGILLGGVPGVPPGKVVVLGGGIVGYNAALIALGMQADVWVLDKSVERMRDLEISLDGRVTLAMSNRLQIEQSIADADLVIGAVLVPGAVAPKLVTREMLALMKPGAVIVDVAIDQGGCFETSIRRRTTTPCTRSTAIVHYCVANMPGAVPITSTKALTNVTLPYVEAIADKGLARAIAEDAGARRRASTCSAARSRTRRSPRHTGCRTRRSETCSARRSVARSAYGRAIGGGAGLSPCRASAAALRRARS